MKFPFSLSVILLTATLVVAQDTPSGGPNGFHDDLLNHLVGKWNVSGTVHGNPSTQTIEAEWVLNHQFLRVVERSVENMAGKNANYEEMQYIGYDQASKRYVAHLITAFGGADSTTLGYGQRTGNHLEFVYQYPDEPISSQLIWEPDSNTWHLLWQQNTKGAQPHVDLLAKPALPGPPASRPESPQPTSGQPSAGQLFGTWRLLSVEETMKDGSVRFEPRFGPHPQGFIMYEPDGHMCVEIMNPDRPSWKESDKPTNEQRLAAFDGFIAYCGTYELDPEHSTVTHYPKVAWTPPFVGSTQPRPFRIEGKRLIITPANIDPAPANEGVVKRVLTWERAE